MIYYTIYTSIPTGDSSKEVIDQITDESIAWNSKHGITGILLCLEKRYFQFLEGEEKDVTEVFEMIRKDPRHTDISIRIKGFAKDRVFSEW
ncbi:MAG: BLUF domain-containing protein, partial [Bacteroidota bacterium]